MPPPPRVVYTGSGEPPSGGRRPPLSAAQLTELRTLLAWSDGEGVDAETAMRLLDEIERLQEEIALLKALLPGPPDAGSQH